MTEIRVDAEALNNLLDKLRAVDLGEDERQLLDALLAIAGDVIVRAKPIPMAARVDHTGEDETPYAVVDSEALDPLRDQLKNAFTSGHVPKKPARPVLRMSAYSIDGG